MREILFRGKVKAGYKWIAEGEWIEGSLLSDDESEMVCQIATSCLPKDKNGSVMVIAYEVDSETVCQYSGIKDKNGKKIFDNDIIHIPGIGNYVVKFEYGQACLPASVQENDSN